MAGCCAGWSRPVGAVVVGCGARPVGGMFLWVQLPEGMDAQKLLPLAVERGMAFVPGAPFYPGNPLVNTLRLSYVTVPPAQIAQGIAALAAAIQAYPQG